MKAKKPNASQQAQFQKARALHGSGRLSDAETEFQKLLKQFPAEPQLLGELGLIALKQGHYQRGAEFLCRAVRINPGDPALQFYAGMALALTNRLELALAAYEQAVKLSPDYAEAHYQRADTLKNLGRWTEAVTAYELTISLDPQHAAAWNDRGLALQELRKFSAALESHNRAIAIQPDYGYAYYNRGIAYQSLSLYAEALASYEQALALIPNDPRIHVNRGLAFKELKNFQAALDSFQNARLLNPGYPFLSGQLLYAKMQICDWRGLDQAVAELAEKITETAQVAAPFIVQGLLDEPGLQRQAAEIWVAARFPANPVLSELPKYPEHQRIRVAYFSAEFRMHAVSILTAELFEIHDRKRFEVFGFSLGPQSDEPMRLRLESAFDQFLDVHEMTDLQIASLARELEIDIAIDLGGHTGDARPGVFAMRAAPLQIGYLGFLGTMGAAYMDYLIADPVLIPEHAKDNYLEKIIYLPCYQVNDSKRRIADMVFSRAQLGLPESGFVFCCFNNNYKITPEIFASWMRILKKLPGSVLLLLADNESAQANLMAAAVAEGVAAERLVFAGRLPFPEYLARYRIADLFLDTYPYNAGTTASDALWAGLPVLTLCGAAFASRVAASLLSGLGLPELITSTIPEYEARAVVIGAKPQYLLELKKKLAGNRLSAPLFDSRGFAVHLEDAYRQIHQRQQAGLPPVDVHASVSEEAMSCSQ